MQCPQCHSDNREGRHYCAECGAPLATTCPECGFANEPSEGFCGGCGTALTSSASAAVSAADTVRTATNRYRPHKGSPHENARRRETLEPERRQLTVMFCDLVGSTRLSHRLDPEDLREVIRGYQHACAEIITRYEGVVSRFMGDGILVLFGYPRAHEDDAERAVRAGLEIAEAIPALDGPCRSESLRLAVRIGIASGLVVAGDLIGEGAAEEEAVVGETPNLAARLERLAQPNTVVIGLNTQRLLGERFEYEALGCYQLDGFSEPLSAWRIIRPREVVSRFEAAHAAALTPLVGREEEIDFLLDRWDQAKKSEGQVVVLSGEAGIGKSRIAQTLRERVASTETHVRIRYQCSPYHTNSALYPFMRHLERAANFKRDDTNAQKLDKLATLLAKSASRVEEVAPLLARLLSIPAEGRYPPLSMSPQQLKARTLAAMVEQMDGLTKRELVLLIFEDTHWIDPTSQELLDLIVEHTQRVRALVIVTCRPECRPPWTDQAHVTVCELDRLNPHQSAVMVAGVARGKALPQEVTDQIVTKTDGVPLFVEELTNTILASGLLKEEPDRYLLSGRPLAMTIPTTLQDSLMARLDQLGAVKRMAQIAAAIGREFSYELLAMVCALPHDELQRALAQLTQAGLIFQRGMPPDASYIFKHALVQDAAYESLLKSRRQELHTRIAQVLEQRADVEPELLAHHYTEAGLIRRAIPYWQQAGHRAIERSAHAEAISHLTQGLELLQRVPDAAERIQQELALRMILGPALMANKGYGAPEVEQAYARARELCQQVKESPRLFPALFGLWGFHLVRAEYKTAYELAEQLLSLAESIQEAGLLVEAHGAVGVTLFYLGELVSARGHLEQSMALYDPERHQSHALTYGQDPWVACRSWLGQVLWLLGYPDQALERGHEALARAQALPHPFSVAFALLGLAMVHQFRREPGASQQQADAMLALCKQQGFPFWVPAGNILRGWALAQSGHEEGMAQIRQGLDARRAMGVRLPRPYFFALLAEGYGKTGQAEAALNALTDTVGAKNKTAERWWEAEQCRLKGELLLAASVDPTAPAVQKEAAECFRRALEIARRQGAKSLELRAAVSLARIARTPEKRGKKRQLLREIYGWFSEGFDTPDLQEAKVLLERLS